MSRLFIVLEGLSASGKTTICKLLAEELDAIFYQSPPQSFKPIRNFIDIDASLNTRFFFYLTGNIHTSTEIEELYKDKTVVCDRYFISTICTHKVMGVNTDEYIAYSKLPLKIPDFSFLITCDAEIRTKRMNSRGLDHNDKREINFNLDNKIMLEYKKYPELIRINNSTDDPMDAVKNIINYIKQNRKIE